MSDIWRQKLKIYYFEEEIIEIKDMKTNKDRANGMRVQSSGLMDSFTTIQKMKVINDNSLKEKINRIKNTDISMIKIINHIKPDIMTVNGFVWMPSVMNSYIPWVWSMSCNPLCMDYGIDDERLPPSLSGQKFEKVWFFLEMSGSKFDLIYSCFDSSLQMKKINPKLI